MPGTSTPARGLQARGVTKAYQGRPVLWEVSLEVAPGEILGLVGPNGAGKTTFLKCVAGVARPDAGSIRLDGVDAAAHPVEARRRFGYAPGDPRLYDRLRVAELLDFLLAFHPSADPAGARRLVQELGVPLEQRAGRLSHGMKRKVLLAQALASGAPLLLLDEPLDGLDPEVRRTAEDLLLEAAGGGRAVLLSSHDLASVQRTCQRVAFLRQGRLLDQGPVAAFLERIRGVLAVELREARTRESLPWRPGWRWRGGGNRWQLVAPEPLEEVLRELAVLPLAEVRSTGASLEEVFEALYGPEGGGDGARRATP